MFSPLLSALQDVSIKEILSSVVIERDLRPSPPGSSKTQWVGRQLGELSKVDHTGRRVEPSDAVIS